jgi:hypothetical protein
MIVDWVPKRPDRAAGHGEPSITAGGAGQIGDG